MPFPVGSDILDFSGVTAPSDGETEWADACASAVEDGITTRLNGAAVVDPIPDELYSAAILAGANCYKRRESSFANDFAGSAANIVGDYLEGVKPIIDRYSNGPGIG